VFLIGVEHWRLLKLLLHADGTTYPSILFMTGANDGRVAPYHSRKMVARLEEANKSANPILLRLSLQQ